MKIISAEHNPFNVRISIPDFDGDAQRRIESISAGGWDASEYGISRAAAVAQIRAANTPAARDRVMRELKKRALDRAGIDNSNGRMSVAVAGEPAWHGLGINIESAFTSGEGIVQANLDWQVEQWVLSVTGPDGTTRQVDSHVANIRSDTKAQLGIVGSGYVPLQNSEAFSFLDAIVGEGGARYESAGAVQGGKRIWLLAQLPDRIEVGKGDITKCYALLSHGHDGLMAISILPTTIRVVCANTMRVALAAKDSKKLYIRHTANMKGRVEDARKCLGLISTRMQEFKHSAEALASVSLKDSEVLSYFEELYPTKVKPLSKTKGTDGANLLDSILNASGQEEAVVKELLEGHYAETERIAKNNAVALEQLLDNYYSKQNEELKVAGTAWAALQAVTHHVDHEGKYRSEDSRQKATLFGTVSDVKEVAYQNAMAFVS